MISSPIHATNTRRIFMISLQFETVLSIIEWLRTNVLRPHGLGDQLLFHRLSYLLYWCHKIKFDGRSYKVIESNKKCNDLKVKWHGKISDKKNRDNGICDSCTGVSEDPKVLGCLLTSICKQWQTFRRSLVSSSPEPQNPRRRIYLGCIWF